MSLSDHTYKVIRLPAADELRGYPNYYLGRSLKGVYCTKDNLWNGLQLWHLDESRHQTEWVLKHDIDLTTFARNLYAFDYRKRYGEDRAQKIGGPWILQDVNYRKGTEEYRSPYYRAPLEEKYDWNSDEDNFLDIEDVVQGGYSGDYRFLGFHPYKEIVYLELCMGRGVAYDWNSSKFQDLGCIEPRDHHYVEEGITASFPYTPCWMGEFPGNELESLLEDEAIARRKLEREAQLEDHSNFSFVDEYELHKLRGRAKREKDSVSKIRRRRRVTAR
jgi:hypothetical protein